MINNTPYALVSYYESENKFFHFKIADIVADKQTITISGYKAEVTTHRYGISGIKFGCKTISSNQLIAFRDLLNTQDSEMKVDLKINGTEITKEMLEKLIKMCI